MRRWRRHCEKDIDSIQSNEGERGYLKDATAAEASLKFGHECTATSVFERKIALATSFVLVERLEGSNSRTITTTLDVAEDRNALLIVEEGVILARGETSARWKVIPPKTLVAISGPKRVLLRVARGKHVGTSIIINPSVHPLLAYAMQRLPGEKNGHEGLRGLTSRGYFPHFEPAAQRMMGSLGNGKLNAELAVFSMLYEGVAFLSEADDSIGLAPIPADIPENIRLLVEEVRATPDQPWPLKEASDRVGYSPFHFSRMFKQLSGFGFHEFVDRTRTESAVEELCATDTPVDLVASNAGFGTTQGLRESIKEYLGLVPTELRSEPDDALL